MSSQGKTCEKWLPPREPVSVPWMFDGGGHGGSPTALAAAGTVFQMRSYRLFEDFVGAAWGSREWASADLDANTVWVKVKVGSLGERGSMEGPHVMFYRSTLATKVAVH